MIITDERFIRNDTIKTWALVLALLFLCACISWLMYHDRKDRKLDAEYRIQIEKDINDAGAKRWGKENWGILPPEKPAPVKKKGEKS